MSDYLIADFKTDVNPGGWATTPLNVLGHLSKPGIPPHPDADIRLRRITKITYAWFEGNAQITDDLPNVDEAIEQGVGQLEAQGYQVRVFDHRNDPPYDSSQSKSSHAEDTFDFTAIGKGK
jgi:hypothetical protein